MGIKSDTTVGSDINYSFQRKAGRSIIDQKPVFTPDGESICVIVENSVRVYNIQTSECTRTLDTENVVNNLVAIEFPENDSYNLYGCSEEGYVTNWTWESGVVLREIKLQIPQNAKVLTFNLLEDNNCIITYIGASERIVQFSSFSVKSGHIVQDYETRFPYFNFIRISIGCLEGSKFAALINGTKILFIQNLDKPTLKSEIISQSQFRIISLACHRADGSVAISDTLGRVYLLRGYIYNPNQVAKEQLHWHFLPALDICFSLQGSYLYTGGMEKVLVKWTIGHLANKAYEKEFIPRLPGMVRYITASQNHVALTLNNNAIVIASTQMRTVCTILECGGLSPAAMALGTPLVYHKVTGALLMTGRTGHLQVYSTTTDKVLYNVDITQMNSLPSERKNMLPVETEVVCLGVSGNGGWVVTSEYRDDGFTYPEERLKFWNFAIKRPTPFKLITCVNLSHGGCKVVSIALNYKGDFCITAGTDQKFRIWKREFVTKYQNSTSGWSCLTACYYSSGMNEFLSSGTLNDYKIYGYSGPDRPEKLPYMRHIRKDDIINRILNMHKEKSLDTLSGYSETNMGGVAISQDGSLIAAWFGCKLTLWDTHLCNLRTSLSHPALRPRGVDVKFGNNDAAHYLVCTTESCLAVWSILSLTVKWMVQLRPTCLASDPLSNKMAVITDQNDLYVFTPHSSAPILVKKSLLDPQTGVFKQCTFGTTSTNQIRLYAMRNNSEIYCLEPEKSSKSNLEVISRRNLPTSNFGALLAEQQLSEVKGALPGQVNEININALGDSAISQFLSGAPHMVPPVSLLCTSFLQHISGHEEAEEPVELLEDVKEIDPTSSEDEDEVPRKEIHTNPTELWTPNYEKVKEKRLNKILRDPLLDLSTTASVFGVSS